LFNDSKSDKDVSNNLFNDKDVSNNKFSDKDVSNNKFSRNSTSATINKKRSGATDLLNDNDSKSDNSEKTKELSEDYG
jgi:hypothetical protein